MLRESNVPTYLFFSPADPPLESIGLVYGEAIDAEGWTGWSPGVRWLRSIPQTEDNSGIFVVGIEFYRLFTLARVGSTSCRRLGPSASDCIGRAMRFYGGSAGLVSRDEGESEAAGEEGSGGGGVPARLSLDVDVPDEVLTRRRGGISFGSWEEELNGGKPCKPRCEVRTGDGG